MPKDGKIFDDTRNSSKKPLEFQMKRPEELNGMFVKDGQRLWRACA